MPDLVAGSGIHCEQARSVPPRSTSVEWQAQLIQLESKLNNSSVVPRGLHDCTYRWLVDSAPCTLLFPPSATSITRKHQRYLPFLCCFFLVRLTMK